MTVLHGDDRMLTSPSLHSNTDGLSVSTSFLPYINISRNYCPALLDVKTSGDERQLVGRDAVEYLEGIAR